MQFLKTPLLWIYNFLVKICVWTRGTASNIIPSSLIKRNIYPVPTQIENPIDNLTIEERKKIAQIRIKRFINGKKPIPRYIRRNDDYDDKHHATIIRDWMS